MGQGGGGLASRRSVGSGGPSPSGEAATHGTAVVPAGE